MDWKLFTTVFASVFLAEMADKTQLATLLFASRPEASRWLVFVAASLALVASSAVAVTAGSLVSQWLDPRWTLLLAGGGFMVIGAWFLVQGLAAA